MNDAEKEWNKTREEKNKNEEKKKRFSLKWAHCKQFYVEFQ